MTDPKITYVRFHNPMPCPVTPSRSKKEVSAADVEGPISRGQHGIMYTHPKFGRILVPWTSVHHCRVEAAPAAQPKKKPGRPPKKPPAESAKA